MKVNENLKLLRQTRNMTQNEVAEILNVSLSSYQKYEREKNSVIPSLDVLIRIADYYGVSVDYLLGRETGEPTAADKLAEQFNMSVLEREILDGYVNLPKEMRGNLMEFLHKAVQSAMAKNTIKESPPEPNYINISYIADKVSAGIGENLADYENMKSVRVPDTAEARKADFVLQVDGDSMTPTFNNGDYILVKSMSAIDLGAIGVFGVNGKGYVKQYGGTRLISHNTDYPDIPITEDTKCFGLVLGTTTIIL